MKTSTRRKFIKSVSVLGLSIPLLNHDETFGQFNDSFTFHSPFLKATMQKDYPRLTSLLVDSLGKNKAGNNPLLVDDEIKNKYRNEISGKSISYWLENQQKNILPAWKFI